MQLAAIVRPPVLSLDGVELESDVAPARPPSIDIPSDMPGSVPIRRSSMTLASASNAEMAKKRPTTSFAVLNRRFDFGDDAQDGVRFISNAVITSRYTAWNFLPKNLYEQFHIAANIYFLLIGILQAIPSISVSRGIPTIYIPLLLILTISAIRAAVEDWRRHLADNEMNSKRFQLLRKPTSGNQPSNQYATSSYAESDPRGQCNLNAELIEFRQSGDILVGDILVLHHNSEVPADAVILHSSHEKGRCLVETASLDGETNFKLKVAPIVLQRAIESQCSERDSEHSARVAQLVRSASGQFACEAPNSRLDLFKGRLNIQIGNTSFMGDDALNIDASNLVLRGTIIKNTDCVMALVVYTGDETKIRMNCARIGAAPITKSNLMLTLDRILMYQFVAQLVLCLIFGVLSGSMIKTLKPVWYLRLDKGINATVEGVYRFFSWIIVFAIMVPISLIVSSEIIKTGQALFMQWDREMWNPVTERGLSVQNSTLNEDLGQVQKVFSDKTGTLTQNVMTFRVAIVGSCTFGSMETEIMKRVRARKAELAAELRESDAESDTGTETSNGENLKRPGMLWSQRLYAVNNPDKPVPGQSIDSILQVDESPVAAALAARAELLRILWSSPASSNESSELSSSSESVRRYLIQCAINNTVDAHIIEATGAIEYHSSSPDELALCEYAAFMGFTLIGRDPTRVRVHSFGMGPADQILEFERLATFDFNASRKRASLVYRPLSPTPSDQLLVMSKGADSAMLPLLFESASATSSPGIASPSRQSSLVHPWTGLPHLAPLLDRMADAGLRTLVLGEAVRPLTWWSDHLASEYKEVTSLSEEGDEDGHSQGSCAKTCRICSFFQEAEASAKLALLGATAIEDLLQDLVPETVADMLSAGVRVYMLTGDKRQTAKNIALACNLIDPDTTPAAGPAFLRSPSSETPMTPSLRPLQSPNMKRRHSFGLDGPIRPAAIGNSVLEIIGSWNARIEDEAELVDIFYHICGTDAMSPLSLDAQSGVNKYARGANNPLIRLELMLLRLGTLLKLPSPLMDYIRSQAIEAIDPAAGLEEPLQALVDQSDFVRLLRKCRISTLDAVRLDLASAVSVARSMGATHPRLDAAGITLSMKMPHPTPETAGVKRLSTLRPHESSFTEAITSAQAPAIVDSLKHPFSIVLEGAAMTALYAPVTTGAMRSSIFNVGTRSKYRDGYEVDDTIVDPATGHSERASVVQKLMQDDVFWLMSLCKSMIACRLTPAQKAKLVEESQLRAPDALTLAIGDGNNDEPMIRQANVGVGIAGKEGSAAARAADYAVPDFKSLHSLLLVHGVWNYHRMAVSIQYIFYKSTIMAAIAAIFAFYSAFSGEQYFNDLLVQLYGIVFTSVPIIAVGISDQALPREVLENQPGAYRSIRRGALFNVQSFVQWILLSCVHAIVVYFVPYFGLSQVVNHWEMSTISFSAICVVANLELLFLHTHSVFIHTALVSILSIAFVPLVLLVISTGRLARAINYDFISVPGHVFSRADSWLSLLLSVALALLVSFVARYVQITYRPSVMDRLRDMYFHK